MGNILAEFFWLVVVGGDLFWLGGDGWGSVGMSGGRWGIYFGSVGISEGRWGWEHGLVKPI